MVIPPADLERPAETQAEETTEQPEPPKLTIPKLNIDVPIPETAVVVTAVTTTAVSGIGTSKSNTGIVNLGGSGCAVVSGSTSSGASKSLGGITIGL